ncbi:HipA domain-containing protein [Actinosynnema sp. NPDC051121]
MAVDSLLIQLQIPSSRWIDVGYLRNSKNKIWMEFLTSYWDMARRPVLGQRFEERGRSWRPSSTVAIPNWFSHLLPEGRLRQAVANAAHTDPKFEFDLLRRLGASDLPGAVRVVPHDESGIVDVPGMLHADHEEDDEDPILKFSLAGAQLKFSVYSQAGRGITVPAWGQAGNVILKFPDGRPGFEKVPEAELGCLRLADASGINAANGFLVDPHEVRGLEDWASRAQGLALAVERFDRGADGVRIHMEELAQVLGIPTSIEMAKYRKANFELVAVLVGALCGVQSIAEVIDRIVLNVLVGNGDAHLKNWAVVYPDGRTPRLSPMYDVLPTILYIANDNLGLKLNKSRLFEDVSPASFERLGIRTGYGPTEARKRAIEAAGRILSQWNTLKEYLPAAAFASLTDRLKRISLAV